MRKKLLVIVFYCLIFIMIGCSKNKEEAVWPKDNVVLGKPCMEPGKKNWSIHNAKDIRENFSAMPVYPTDETQDDIYLLGKTENFTLYGKGNYESLLLESNGCYSEIFYPYTSNYMNLPELYELDIDKDGALELGIKLHLQKGTELSIHNLLLADFNEENVLYVYQYREEDFTEDLQKVISFEDVEGGIYPLLNGGKTGIYMEDKYENDPFTSIGVGAIMHFSFDDIQEEIWLTGAFLFERKGSVMYETDGSAVKALVGWDGNEFFLSQYQVVLEEEKTLEEKEQRKEAKEGKKAPTREEVLELRKLVTEGMTEEEITRLSENIKVANLTMEEAYLYDSLFERLEDPEDLYWNYVDDKGEIQIGWDLSEKHYVAASGLTRNEWGEKYGKPIMVYNRFHAENFIALMEEMRDSIHHEVWQEDFNILIEKMEMAKKTHDVKYMIELYRILHDMDYFLLRYGPEDVGKYTKDDSTVNKFYGVLLVHDDPLKD
ncbi:MAG: hypothetical protein IKW28_02085 [Lachnospiraceae bacterium]|nr:hypothetical protein [Lachnospiraceae bacterium]